MARKTKEEAQQTRNNLLAAAISLFARRGVSRTSLAEIANEAGVTRGAIYWHFSNKGDLLDALWQQILLPTEQLAQASENQDEPDPLGKMRQLFILLLTRLQQEPQQRQIFDILLHKCEWGDDLGQMQLRHDRRQPEAYAGVQKALANAVRRGQLPAELDTRMGAICLMSFVDGLISNWLQNPALFDLAAAAPHLIDGAIAMLRYGPIRDGQIQSRAGAQ